MFSWCSWLSRQSNTTQIYILRKQPNYKTTLKRRLDHINTASGASDTSTSTRHTRTEVGRHVYWSRRITVVDAGEERNAGEGHQRRHGRMVPDGLTALSVGKAGAGGP